MMNNRAYGIVIGLEDVAFETKANTAYMQELRTHIVNQAAIRTRFNYCQSNSESLRKELKTKKGRFCLTSQLQLIFTISEA